MTQDQDTICALATPTGIGAIGMIRLSGSQSLTIISAVFSKSLENKASHTTHFGVIKTKEGKLIDEVLVTVFEEGKSFTGEQSAEISCHGSSFILQQILRTLIEEGARIASPGEYTQRAFLNGKMDLSQAEAVADLIASKSKLSHSIALKQLRGGFSSELKMLREKLINFASLIELELDFAEEDVEFADRTQLKNMVEDTLNYVNRLSKSFELGNAIKNGVPITILGRPNAGKSTLLNALISDERAIVSEIAGTTRDTIEEILNIEGIDFRFIDTAGLRVTSNEIEKIGVERARKSAEKSSAYIYLFDANELSIKEVKEDLKELPLNVIKIIIANKIDKIDKAQLETLKNDGLDMALISAKNDNSLELLKSSILEKTMLNNLNEDETIVTNARHYDALIKTGLSLEKANDGISSGITSDFIAMDIRQAMYELGIITGDISTDDLLGNIFSKFCIGK